MGVLSSWLTLATKSRRTFSTRWGLGTSWTGRRRPARTPSSTRGSARQPLQGGGRRPEQMEVLAQPSPRRACSTSAAMVRSATASEWRALRYRGPPGSEHLDPSPSTTTTPSTESATPPPGGLVGHGSGRRWCVARRRRVLGPSRAGLRRRGVMRRRFRRWRSSERCRPAAGSQRGRQMRFRLVPHDDGFYPLFDEAAENVAECARRLRELLDLFSDDIPAPRGGAREARQSRHRLRARGDELTRTILRRLNSSFVTPLDREDIHALAEEPTTSSTRCRRRPNCSCCTGSRSPSRRCRDLPTPGEGGGGQRHAVAKLPRLRDVEGELEAIGRLETEADHCYRRSVAHLFSGDFKAFAVLKWKDIVEAIEESVTRSRTSPTLSRASS